MEAPFRFELRCLFGGVGVCRTGRSRRSRNVEPCALVQWRACTGTSPKAHLRNFLPAAQCVVFALNIMATHLPGIQDILYHILAHLAADLKSANASFFGQLQSQATRQTLARLATVHSSFTRPTLSVLWRYLRTDKALLHLLTVVGIAREPPRKNWQWDWYGDPPLVSGSDLAAIISMTLMYFAGNARDTRNQRSELDSISTIRFPRARNHPRPVCVPIKACAGHPLVSTLLCTRD